MWTQQVLMAVSSAAAAAAAHAHCHPRSCSRAYKYVKINKNVCTHSTFTSRSLTRGLSLSCPVHKHPENTHTCALAFAARHIGPTCAESIRRILTPVLTHTSTLRLHFVNPSANNGQRFRSSYILRGVNYNQSLALLKKGGTMYGSPHTDFAGTLLKS